MIEQNVAVVKEKILKACEKVHREPGSVTLLAVTKTIGVDDIQKALRSGIYDIGENKIQEAQQKVLAFSNSIKKHFIGHLQTNKAKKAVELFDVIQSVDTLRLLEEVNKCASKINKIQDCLLELKVSDEETKFGLSEEELKDCVQQAAGYKNVRIVGIMAMAPYFEDPQSARPYFKRAKGLFNAIQEKTNSACFSVLSMGMSNDFEVAIEEGATLVRIGSAIFGERKYQ